MANRYNQYHHAKIPFFVLKQTEDLTGTDQCCYMFGVVGAMVNFQFTKKSCIDRKVSKFSQSHPAIAMVKLRKYHRITFLSSLKHTNQLTRKLFFTKLSRILI